MLFTTALNIFIRRVAANPADSVFDSGGKFYYLLDATAPLAVLTNWQFGW